MAQAPPELLAHREWLGQIEPVGLVVSPNVLVRQNVFVERQRSIEVQNKLSALVGDDADPHVRNALQFFREILDWPESALAGSPSGAPIPDSLVAALPEYEDHIRPDYALADPDAPAEWQLLIQVTAASDLDAKPAEGERDGWRASPHARLERLLRETGVSTGILFNGTSLRLVYAPKHESSGHLTFKFKYLLETQGRPMAGALAALLGVERVTDVGAPGQRLSQLLKESRKSQNDVSTALAGQVLEALWELVRGFQHANEASKAHLLEHVMREAPNEVYGGLLTTLMRLVFVLYAEDRGLMPAGPVYQRSYSVAGLFERLREDAARYPDTMDARYGAWAQLLALFRLIHDGGRHGSLRFTARHGRLFSPDAYPFLEGRPHGTLRSKGERVDPPRVSDGVVFRVLRNLLLLDSERLSYRALDVEQIGSVYEAMMGFALEQAPGPAVALSPKHIVININDLLEQKGSERAKWLREQAELKLTSADAVSKAKTVDDVIAALGKKVSRYTPNVLPVGALYLQPTEERRRSGSHYTPRSLTEPIVRTTFRPIFERLGAQATPEQILDLKVCDPAMGSGAFLVEACRLLSDRLVQAWDVHKQTPKVPADEDVHTYARRLVAERCLYGVDKNVFAVDLAKLSLWLATLAREHPFTFLDHSLRHGDSLVGLSREQIACFNWQVEQQMPLLRSLIDERVAEAQRLREQIQGLATSDDVPQKEHLLREAEDVLADVRLIGDVVISAFFERDKPKERQVLRAAYSAHVELWLSGGDDGLEVRAELQGIAADLRNDAHPISPFHWQTEFPEVFSRPTSGFDVFIGNPPFAGKNTMSAANKAHYPVWLQTIHDQSHGNADLVAHFYRRAFSLLRQQGAFGLIATNSISQGKTRATGLGWICAHEGLIFAAQTRIPWPGEAAVVVSVVHVIKGGAPRIVELDGRRVPQLNDALSTLGDYEPVSLFENAELSYIGSYLNGMGFTFDDADGDGMANPISVMHDLVARDRRNAQRIRPYWGGAELNDTWNFEPVRYVIDLDSLDEVEARRLWPDLMKVVELRVRPERAVNTDTRARQFWWQFLRPRQELYRKLAALSRTLVTARNSDTGAFLWMPADHVFSEKIVVFPIDNDSFAAILQSRVHGVWSRSRNTTLKDDLQYTPSECFDNFPLPIGWVGSKVLSTASVAYFGHRTAMQTELRVGLTQLFSRFNDRDATRDDRLKRLRALHDAVDRAVLDAYGWTDIQPQCEFILDYEEDDEDTRAGRPSRKEKPYRYRWPDEIRDEILGRLLELNAERAKAEFPKDANGGKLRARATASRRSNRQASFLE
jgi:hypothetical protein